MVAGQLLAMSPWVPNFEPDAGTVKTALVWLRLPRLPPEYWSTSSILHIAAKAGRPIAVDGVTEQQGAMGFARVKVAIDTTAPLLPGVLIQGMMKVHWQPFVFENVPALCPRCGRMGHADAAACRFPATGRAAGGSSSGAMDPEGGTDQTPPATEEENQGPVYGPWMVATRRRVPWENPPPRPGETIGPDKGLGSSSTRSPPPAVCPTSPASPADTDGCQKPTKVARRWSPLASGGDRPAPAPPIGPVRVALVGNPELDSIEPGDPGPSRRVDPVVSVDLALPRADPGPSGAVVARAQTQKRPRPPAGLGPQGGPGLTTQNIGQAQRARAQLAGRRGRGPTRLIGAPCANGAPLPDDAPGAGGALLAAGAPRTGSAPAVAGAPIAEGAPVAGVPSSERGASSLERQGPRAQLAMGPQALLAPGLGAGPGAQATQGLAGGGPGDSAQPALGPGDLLDPVPLAQDELTMAGGPGAPAGPFQFSPPRQELAVGLGLPQADGQDHPMVGAPSEPRLWDAFVDPGGGPDGVFRFGPPPRLRGCGRTLPQRVRAAVMGVVSVAGGEEEGRDCRGAEPEDGPATLGEDESEADYVDCDP
ncbi:collagen alpha-1(III) chain-like [Phoenix dactylifera]|uniref:Collagen alpha-1(III) chain-like n=1 Tax=Phoenix dactylifera TaxID=42345 RepID=A0A8B8ZT43_PHODC|nr:collagen alpha-1(III) chain-like [Phoenix dactylifera]